MPNTNALPGIGNVSCWVVSHARLCLASQIQRDYIYYQKLKQAQTFRRSLIVRESKSQRSLARCPSTRGPVSRRTHGLGVGWYVANSRTRGSTDPLVSVSTSLPMSFSRPCNLVTGFFPYTELHFYTPTLSPFQLEVSDPLVGRPCPPEPIAKLLLPPLPTSLGSTSNTLPSLGVDNELAGTWRRATW